VPRKAGGAVFWMKRLAARLPKRWQQELKRRAYALQIRAGRFRTWVVPAFDTGLDNFYEASITDLPGGREVFCCAIDSFRFPRPIRLVKVDTEGHELHVLAGMKELLARDHPVLVVEANSDQIPAFLSKFGYACERLAASPNLIARVSA